MTETPRRLPEILAAVLAKRGLKVAPSAASRRPSGEDLSQLVFVGNWQDACPRRLLFDPNLDPVDIVTWQVVRIHADPTRVVAFPSYRELMAAVRVSRATIARALAVLRLTRWLPLCAALRDADGRFAGHVYALNDDPLPLAETIAIDSGYVEFVEEMQRHRSVHVRKLAHETVRLLRAEAIEPDRQALGPVRLAEHVTRRVDVLLDRFGHRVQNPNAAHWVQNLNPDRSSSSQETTTTEVPAPRDAVRYGEVDAALVFPDALSLTDSQRRVLALRLQALTPPLRQDVLDEAAGRVLAKRGTPDPVRCEFDYAARLCAKALQGAFVLTDAGARIRQRRTDSSATEMRLQRARATSEARRLKEIERHRGRNE